MKQQTIYIDFETHPIEDVRTLENYPPRPVGFAILGGDFPRGKYFAYGHPSENNCTWEQAERVLKAAYRSGAQLCCHNGAFDHDVAQRWHGVKMPEWHRCDDTMFELFLDNPHRNNLQLKPAAAELLGLPPQEQDAVHEWIKAHVPEAKNKKAGLGRWIYLAPGALVGRYAVGDVVRTRRMHELLRKRLDAGQQQAYQREQRLMPILLENEKQGVLCATEKLRADIGVYRTALESADAWLRKALHDPNLNIDSDQDFADALERNGVVTEFMATKTGKRSVSKKNLTPDMFKNAKVAAAFGYRNRLSTCISTFMEHWLAAAEANNGLVLGHWNQVRTSKGARGTAGARTGRLSCEGSGFMNSPKNWKKAIAEGYVYPDFVRMIRGVAAYGHGATIPDLPRLRRYFLPDRKGWLWGRRDYNQQELRITAHYEDGDLMRHYREDPRFDLHDLVQRLLAEAGHDLPRDNAKTLNFQDVYGGGDSALAQALKIDIKTAHALKVAKRRMMPDFAALERAVRETGKSGAPIRTWGGRLYYCEPPSYSERFGRVMSYEYKLLNYLIQGSAADCTKEAIIRWFDDPRKTARFLLTVHDEIDLCCSKSEFKQQMQVCREAMQSVEFDVPMLSDGEQGATWGDLQPFKERQYVA